MAVGSVLAAWAPAASAEEPSAQDAGALETKEVRVDGRTYRGTIVEMRPRVSVRMRLAGGDELTVPWSEVVSIDGASRETLEAGTPPQLTREEAAREAESKLPEHWYGWQTLLIDAGSATLLLVGNAAALVGLAGYVVGPPVTHAVHGQGGPAVGSGLLRVTLPFALAVLSWELSNNSTNGSSGAPFSAALNGALLGMLGASAIDAGVLAWEPQHPEPPARGALPAAPSIALTPLLAPASDSRHAGPAGGLALIGSF
jgi:hypothetical protein